MALSISMLRNSPRCPLGDGITLKVEDAAKAEPNLQSLCVYLRKVCYMGTEIGVNSRSFQPLLRGPEAFYAQPDYVESTRRDFAQHSPLPVTYAWSTDCKIVRIIKQLLSFVIFPIAIYQFLQGMIGKMALLPASNPALMGYTETHADESRADITLEGEWKYKRLTIEVDGCAIDAMLVGTPATLNNGRWFLASNGNGEFYEDTLAYRRDFKQILSEMKGNALFFNYPGVGSSGRMPSKSGMVKAYRAMLTFLEDSKEGIGAKEIIGYGHSIGGGVQGEALKSHQLKTDGTISYVFVKSRTFSNVSMMASGMNPALGPVASLMGWDMDSVESSKNLQAPEIILQTANVTTYERLTDSSKIIGDGVIPARASLAKALLDDETCPKGNKVFIGMREHHNDELRDPSFIGREIERFLV